MDLLCIIEGRNCAHYSLLLSFSILWKSPPPSSSQELLTVKGGEIVSTRSLCLVKWPTLFFKYFYDGTEGNLWTTESLGMKKLQMQSGLLGGIFDPICKWYLSELQIDRKWKNLFGCMSEIRYFRLALSSWISLIEKGPALDWNKLDIKFK